MVSLLITCVAFTNMSTAPTCPQCDQIIPADDINVAKDLAYCRKCNLGHALSGLVESAETEVHVDLQNPPAGIWCETDSFRTVIGASHRSWVQALSLLAVALFWNGIVSVFVVFALSGTFHHLGIVPPAWFPRPEMNGGMMSFWGVLFLWLFLTPFIAIGTWMILAFVSTVGGRTEVRIQHGQGSVYVGVGRLGWSRRFDPAQIESIELGWSRWRNSDSDPNSQTEIFLEEKGGRTVKFGSLLNEQRKTFLLSALRQTLL